jgi:1,4-alpha-glucan branching enzyme
MTRQDLHDESGYLLLVLNTHLPFVRHPDITQPFEENWLFEAIVESYLPLIGVCEDLIRDENDFKITFSLSPPLIAMLTDDLLQRRLVEYLDDRIRFSRAEMERLKNEPQLLALVHAHHDRFVTSQKFFQKRDVISAFKELLDSGKVELITSSATHAYLPLWELYPRIVRLQIKLGILQFRNVFGRNAKGFWLPECGFFPGLDAMLRDEGIKYFFLDAHGILNGDPRPKFREYVPIQCPSGVAAFGRDWKSHDLVWLRDKGYPGDPFYRDFYAGLSSGMKYFNGAKEIYDPVKALSRCDEHADHFATTCRQHIEHLHHALGRKPVLAAMFDTEHFGHWWHEGPAWLNLTLRKLSQRQQGVKLITVPDYLDLNPVNQILKPSMSSWGYQGYSETWLMGRNHWIYPAVYEMIELLDQLVDSNVEGVRRDALNQYLRELLLAQSSDWAFMMHSESGQSYAEKRVRDHLENMTKLYHQLTANNVDAEWLGQLRKKNNIFAGMDILEIYETL